MSVFEQKTLGWTSIRSVPFPGVDLHLIELKIIDVLSQSNKTLNSNSGGVKFFAESGFDMSRDRLGFLNGVSKRTASDLNKILIL